MRTANKIAEDYIAVWNESDSGRRRKLMEATFIGGASYVDPLMRGGGIAEIDGLVGAVHARFPGLSFSLVGPADGFGEHVRFSWALGTPGAAPIVKGTDFVVCTDGRIASVVGFLDLVPDAA